MEINHNEVEINGVKYIRKDSVIESKLNTENYVIIRTYSSGVFAGTLVERKEREVQNIQKRGENILQEKILFSKLLFYLSLYIYFLINF